jgi:uncharacterized protein (DUF1800 family)
MSSSTPSETQGPVWDARAAAHLLSRTGFGATPREVARLAALSLTEAVDTLLEEAGAALPPPRPAWVRDLWTNPIRLYADKPTVSEEVVNAAFVRWFQEVDELKAWWLGEMIRTPAPLREMMTLFWHGHFTSAVSTVYISQALYQQNATLRQHALGNFRQLLGAITLDPAMLIYLNLEESDKGRANENYARELLELFTLGTGNYTEKDIKEISRALTGWTLDAPKGTPKQGKDNPALEKVFSRDGLIPTFVPGRHDDGVKTIFGRTANFGLEDVLDWVLRQPAAGRFLADRLLTFFGVADSQGSLKGRLAAAFATEKYEIRPLLRILLTAPEFYAPASRGSLIKGPVHLLVGACRQLHLEVEATPGLAQLTTAMGQELFNPPNVKGWPGGNFWIGAGTLAVRYHLADALLDGQALGGLDPLGPRRYAALPREPGPRQAMLASMLADHAQQKKGGLKVRFEAAKLFPAGAPADPAMLVDALLNRLVLTTLRPSTRGALLNACRAAPGDERVKLVVRLILSSPEYQLA